MKAPKNNLSLPAKIESMNELVIINFEEIYLKGENRSFFIKKLKEQLQKKLKPFQHLLRIQRVRGGSIFMEITGNIDEQTREDIRRILKTTPGITQFYFVKTVKTEKETIIKEALAYTRGKIEDKDSFRVTVKRIDKNQPFTSRELAADIGAAIVARFGTKVNLTGPDWTLYVKVRPEQTFIYSEIEQGIGGLPVGSSGKALAFLSGGIDSPVAAYMAMVRGLHLTALHFHSVPKTSPKSIEKVEKLAGILGSYQGGMRLLLVPVLEIQQEIARKTRSKFRLILLRRFMYKIASEIARETDIKAVITGDSLGQVASQTLENLLAIRAVTDMLPISPLIALDKKFIIRKAREIGTYDISILPHDDACAMFTPERPETRAKLEEVEREWNRLDHEKLIRQALGKTESRLC